MVQRGLRIAARVVLACAVAATVAVVPAVAAPTAASRARAAEKLAATARIVYDQGQFLAAAELYRKAYSIDPAQHDYLYGIGRAEQKAGRLAQARVALEQLLAIIPADDPLATRARKALDEIAVLSAGPADSVHKPGNAQAKPERPAAQEPHAIPAQEASARQARPEADPGNQAIAAVPPPVAPTPSQLSTVARVAESDASTQSRSLAYSAFGAAAVGLACAVGFGIAALQADATADAFRKPGTDLFDPARISEDDARGRIADINGKRQFALAGAGVAALGGVVGMLLWPRAAPASVATGGSQFWVAWRF